MSYSYWKDKTAEFKTVDVRGIQGNFFQVLEKQAKGLSVGQGLEVVQSFEEKDIPIRPAALTNMLPIDEGLRKVAVEFRDLTRNDNKRYLSYEMRSLLSLTNAVGAGRMRQTTRKPINAHIHGLNSAALDDVFDLPVWNQGIGYFSSEIGPSKLFAAYRTIKNMKKQGKERVEICEALKEKFGEKNPDVKVQ